MLWRSLLPGVLLTSCCVCCLFFFFNDTATTEIYTLSLHDALPISMWKSRWNAAAVAGLSLMSTPRNRTPLGVKCWASRDRNGASARHGVHQDPQKFITTTCPCSWARANLLPDSKVPVTRGATGPELARYTVVPGLPDTKLWPLLPGPLFPIAPLSHAPSASAPASPRAAATAARRARDCRGAGLERMPPWRGHRGKRDRVDLLQAVVPRPIVPDPASGHATGVCLA